MLDPVRIPETDASEVLGKYSFKDIARGATRYLSLLATGDGAVPVDAALAGSSWPTSRGSCEAIAETPDPDLALVNLEKVSASLGGKGILWELFQLQPSAVAEAVRRALRHGQYLSEILTQQSRHDRRAARQPRAQPAPDPRRTCEKELAESVQERRRPRSDPAQLSEQGAHPHRRVRDILGKDTILETTHEGSADLAETILRQIARRSGIWPSLLSALGMPALREHSPRVN